MRALLTPLFLVSCLVGTHSHGSSAVMEKVKTGILPSGDTYSIYKVACKDQTSADVARTQRGHRWCASNGSELSCFRHPEQAADTACMNMDIAATDTDADSANAYQ